MAIVRPKWRVRTLLVAVALVAVVLGGWTAIERRSRGFYQMAAYHLQAHGILIEQAGGPVALCGSVDLPDGETWETFVRSIYAARPDPQEYLAYLASEYHWGLFEKYREAAKKPWLLVAADPPAPQLANPRFERDEGYVSQVRSWDEPLSGGFQ